MILKDKKVLVTGGSGMIGRELVNLLIEEDANGAIIESKTLETMDLFFATLAGVSSGIIIGLLAEYYTSDEYGPVHEISKASETFFPRIASTINLHF